METHSNHLLQRCGEPEMPPTIDCDLLLQEYQARCASCAALEEHNANQARLIAELEIELREARQRNLLREKRISPCNLTN